MLEQFCCAGRDLFLQEGKTFHSGNLSVRAGDRMPVTRRGFVPAGPAYPWNHKTAMVRGRGSFAVGQMPEGARRWTSSPQASRVVPHHHLAFRDGPQGEAARC